MSWFSCFKKPPKYRLIKASRYAGDLTPAITYEIQQYGWNEVKQCDMYVTIWSHVYNNESVARVELKRLWLLEEPAKIEVIA